MCLPEKQQGSIVYRVWEATEHDTWTTLTDITPMASRASVMAGRASMRPSWVLMLAQCKSVAMKLRLCIDELQLYF